MDAVVCDLFCRPIGIDASSNGDIALGPAKESANKEEHEEIR
jgi:hypothetical protein